MSDMLHEAAREWKAAFHTQLPLLLAQPPRFAVTGGHVARLGRPRYRRGGWPPGAATRSRRSIHRL